MVDDKNNSSKEINKDIKDPDLKPSKENPKNPKADEVEVKSDKTERK